MSSRTYLSIGDVLTLLREEFPDVTISKIRFLESQGLVNPERSPSGYRKFFDHDVERLRWVLRQQREHFLPLKVIRDRLEDGELEDGETDVANGGVGRPAATGSAVATAPAPGTTATAQMAEQPTKADEEAMARILADASRRAAKIPAEATARRGLQVVGESTSGSPVALDPDGGPPAVPEPVHTGAAPARAGASRRAATSSSSDGGNGVSGSTNRRSKAAPVVAAPEPTPAPPPRRGGGAGTTGGAPSKVTSGTSFTLEELCTAAGLSPEEVKGLQSFGLIESTLEAGIETFDDDAVTVAKLAVSFGSYGVEPRHLRLYRNAVDREVGLIEQVVIPLLRLRNPESRQRAVESAEELASLGESMRATLLRAALRRHLGG